VARLGFVINDAGTELTRTKEDEEPDITIDLEERDVMWELGSMGFSATFQELFTIVTKIRQLAKMKKVKE
jgi:hypothetical protein